MKKIEEDIKYWHLKTFPNANNTAIINKAIEEIGEFQAASLLCEKQIYEEAADIAIVLIALCERNNIHLSELIESKMKINKLRSWGQEDKNGGRLRVK